MNQYVLLAAMWIGWCVVHSVLISAPVTESLKRRAGNRFRFYRLFFNVVSLGTLIPVVMYGRFIESNMVFRWEGFALAGQVLLLAVAIFFFVAGARHYDLYQFAGLRQLRAGKTHGALSAGGELDMTGVLGMTRHPWYLATIALIWARNLDISAIMTNVILTSYLVVGTILEERKLLNEYGDEYRDYQKRVSMLIPWKMRRESRDRR